MYGFFARKRTDPPQPPSSSGVPARPSCLRPPPSPTHSSRRVRGHVAFAALQVICSGPTTGRASRPISLPLIGVLTPRCCGDPASPPEVTPCSSVPCRPHTPWSEGWMDRAFVAILPTRPSPLFGRPVHPWGSPHRLRPGTSPQALRIPPRDGDPALPGSPCRGQRGITPAFGYGALHPSARGTSTLLNTALLSAQYGPIRLPPAAPRPSGCPWGRGPRDVPAATGGSPRFRTLPVHACRRLRPRWTRVRARLRARSLVPSPPLHTDRRPRCSGFRGWSRSVPPLADFGPQDSCLRFARAVTHPLAQDSVPAARWLVESPVGLPRPCLAVGHPLGSADFARRTQRPAFWSSNQYGVPGIPGAAAGSVPAARKRVFRVSAAH
jgi:hypothetical protein